MTIFRGGDSRYSADVTMGEVASLSGVRRPVRGADDKLAGRGGRGPTAPPRVVADRWLPRGASRCRVLARLQAPHPGQEAREFTRLLPARISQVRWQSRDFTRQDYGRISGEAGEACPGSVQFQGRACIPPGQRRSSAAEGSDVGRMRKEGAEGDRMEIRAVAMRRSKEKEWVGEVSSLSRGERVRFPFEGSGPLSGPSLRGLGPRKGETHGWRE